MKYLLTAVLCLASVTAFAAGDITITDEDVTHHDGFIDYYDWDYAAVEASNSGDETVWCEFFVNDMATGTWKLFRTTTVTPGYPLWAGFSAGYSSVYCQHQAVYAIRVDVYEYDGARGALIEQEFELVGH